MPRSAMTGSYGSCMYSFFNKSPNCFPKWLYYCFNFSSVCLFIRLNNFIIFIYCLFMLFLYFSLSCSVHHETLFSFHHVYMHPFVCLHICTVLYNFIPRVDLCKHPAQSRCRAAPSPQRCSLMVFPLYLHPCLLATTNLFSISIVWHLKNIM